MKTTVLKFFTLSAAIFAFSTISFGQATGTAQAAANIDTPISITKNIDLNFGNIAASGSNFTVGVRSASNATAILDAVGEQAIFSVTGQESQSFKVTPSSRRSSLY